MIFQKLIDGSVRFNHGTDLYFKSDKLYQDKWYYLDEEEIKQLLLFLDKYHRPLLEKILNIEVLQDKD